jgi:hypothetical protein
MMQLRSGILYQLASELETVELIFVSTMHIGNNVWHRFQGDNGLFDYIEISDYLCSPKGNYRLLGRDHN